jgi:hypothetical protein
MRRCTYRTKEGGAPEVIVHAKARLVAVPDRNEPLPVRVGAHRPSDP